MILNDTILKKTLKKVIEKEKEVHDIVVFGSAIRGKEKPRDIDVLVIFKKNVNKEIEYQIRKEIGKRYETVSIISKTVITLFDAAFDARESILFEGKSLLTGATMGEQYGYAPLGMFKYRFKEWSKLQKTKYYHALNGRNGKKGVAQGLGCVKLSDGIILVPLHNIEEFRSFLKLWKLEFLYIPALIPARLNKKEILEAGSVE
jgi:predicted nucleotidyltransferase